jgi:tetratricopeptide (TPR) repeat protein
MGRLEQALDYYEKARAMITYKGLLAVNLHVTGQIYYGFGQLEQAVDFFQRALLALSDVDNLYELAKIHKNLGLAYRRLGHPQQALNHLQQALDAVQKLGSHPDERTILYNLALLLLRQGRVVGAAIQLRHLIRRGLP